MKNKAYRLISIAFLAAMLLLSGCVKLSQVSMTSVALDSISPKGMRSLTVSLSVGVHNPATEITISEISGEVLVSGKVIGNMAMAPVVLTARTDSTYKVKADVAAALFTSSKTASTSTTEEGIKTTWGGGRCVYSRIPLSHQKE